MASAMSPRAKMRNMKTTAACIQNKTMSCTHANLLAFPPGFVVRPKPKQRPTHTLPLRTGRGHVHLGPT
jgi:hypothetical protein